MVHPIHKSNECLSCQVWRWRRNMRLRSSTCTLPSVDLNAITCFTRPRSTATSSSSSLVFHIHVRIQESKSPMSQCLVWWGCVLLQWEPPVDGTAYIGLAYALRQYPNSTEFVYLRRLDKHLTVYNPYALDVVPFTAVDPDDFYTMSVRGVTHYVNGVSSDFTHLDQWEREYQLFNAMSTLTVFNKYKVCILLLSKRKLCPQFLIMFHRHTVCRNAAAIFFKQLVVPCYM